MHMLLHDFRIGYDCGLPLVETSTIRRFSHIMLQLVCTQDTAGRSRLDTPTPRLRLVHTTCVRRRMTEGVSDVQGTMLCSNIHTSMSKLKRSRPTLSTLTKCANFQMSVLFQI